MAIQLADAELVLTYQVGNGFSFDSFSVSVPEPASGLLLLFGLAAFRLRRDRQR